VHHAPRPEVAGEIVERVTRPRSLSGAEGHDAREHQTNEPTGTVHGGHSL